MFLKFVNEISFDVNQFKFDTKYIFSIGALVCLMEDTGEYKKAMFVKPEQVLEEVKSFFMYFSTKNYQILEKLRLNCKQHILIFAHALL